MEMAPVATIAIPVGPFKREILERGGSDTLDKLSQLLGHSERLEILFKCTCTRSHRRLREVWRRRWGDHRGQLLDIFCSFEGFREKLDEYGSWVVVTGATDGIGKALAFELASKDLSFRNRSDFDGDHSIIIISSVEVKSVVVDLAKCSGKELGEIIDKEIKGLDIRILINNAGLGYSYPQFLHEVDLEIMEDIFKAGRRTSSAETSTGAASPNQARCRK
ncbi:hypothetical protein F8388_024412 [Cannabis sativa]|uniref:Uncharacterized protein n=1 Tax=Cannabis sativa TaxID=3483 RepID=A0A7J6EHG6_CANSA|nr:hypothetical protein F8388_024412 [Cannabis sativa]